MKKALLIVLVLLLGVLLVSQLIPVDKSLPDFDPEKDILSVVDVPDDVQLSLSAACYDCHSFETRYPWYSKVNIIGRWVQGHVEHGRHHLNFSVWGDYSEEDIAKICEEIVEEVELAQMPMSQYLPMHPEARLGDAARKELIEFFQGLPERTSSNTSVQGDEVDL